MQVISIPSPFTYSNLYVLSGYPQGTSLLVTSNSSSPAFLIQASLPPLAESDQFPLIAGKTILITGSDVPIWIRGGTGPIVVQSTTETITPFTSVDFPHDVYTNNVEDQRRYKVSSEPSIGAAVFNGFAYTISGTFSVDAGDYLALNLSPASDIIVHKVVTNAGFPIEVYDALATGVADGIFTSANMNLLSVDSSPTQGQLFSDAVPVGKLISAGVGVLEPYVVAGFNKKPAILVKNTSAVTTVMRLTVTFEEIGPRASSFGLTASTELFATTEMSTFG